MDARGRLGPESTPLTDDELRPPPPPAPPAGPARAAVLAENAGMIGLISEANLGNLFGDDIGDSFGFGGLGLTGLGTGEGGLSTGIGQLGGSDGAWTAPPGPARSEIAVDAVALDAGPDQTCAVARGGDVWCWGGRDGALRRITGVQGATAVSVGEAFACALTREGAVACWGALGRETVDEPRFLDGIVGAVQVEVGRAHGCARSDAAVWCFGDDRWGQLGVGGGRVWASPRRVGRDR
jgi:hypothetical protein